MSYPYPPPAGAKVASLGQYPSNVTCPSCHQTGITRVEYEAGGTTHMWAAIACFCLCLGCIPYLMTSLKDVKHFCSHCGTHLAVWHRSGGLEVVAHEQPMVSQAPLPIPAPAYVQNGNGYAQNGNGYAQNGSHMDHAKPGN